MNSKHRQCNQDLNKLLSKIKHEINKVDKLFCNGTPADGTSGSYIPTSDEKRKVIQEIKCRSEAYKSMLEELGTLRTDIKSQVKRHDELIERRFKLCQLQTKQLEKVVDMKNDIKNHLQAPKRTQENVDRSFDIVEGQNKQLEEDFKKVMEQYYKWIQDLRKENERGQNRHREIVEQYNRDQILIKLLIRYIQEVFNLRAMSECKKLCILDYAFPKDAKDIDCEPSTSQYEGCRCDD